MEDQSSQETRSPLVPPAVGRTELDIEPNSAIAPDDRDIRKALDHMEINVNRASPFSRWQYIPVTFPANVNTDTVITHRLNADNPESIMWTVFNLQLPTAPGTAPVVYRDSSGNRRGWMRNYIVLRSNIANLQATIFVAIPRHVSNAALKLF